MPPDTLVLNQHSDGSTLETAIEGVGGQIGHRRQAEGSSKR